MNEEQIKVGLAMFGLTALRAGQREAMESIFSGKDALVVMPTGSGKSLCFQLPAMLGDGLTLCLSPLIALMKDQVDGLHAAGLPAGALHSHMTSEERALVADQVRGGQIRLLYVAPERLTNRDFRAAIAAVAVERLVVDEAHCVSQWGHDFRPDYLAIGELRRELGSPPIVALTATATRRVQQDIAEQLALQSPDIHVHGFERPNLSFQVHHAPSPYLKGDRLVDLVRGIGGSSVVYCATRRQTDEVASILSHAGLRVGRYHAGMKDGARTRVQEEWMRDEFETLAATNAFGMGVDKPDVRGIIHFNVPGSLEAYYQEAGRAGRDGAPAKCMVLYHHKDRGIHEFFIRNSYPAATWYEALWADLSRGKGKSGFETSIDDLCLRAQTGERRIHAMAMQTMLRKLAAVGHIEVVGAGSGVVRIDVIDPGAPLRVDFAALAQRRQVAERQLMDVVGWVESSSACRQASLVRYFNSEPSFGARCGVCDYCAVTSVDADIEVLVRKVLSGVARSSGRAGRTAIVNMLCGHSNHGVKMLDLENTSTFGVLSSMREETVASMLSACERNGLVEGRRRRSRVLTPLGAEVMTGRVLPDERLQQSFRRALKKARR